MIFRFRPVLSIFALVAFGVLLSLGAWQLRRLEWKRDLIARVEARVEAEPAPFARILKRWRDGEDMEYLPVFAEGAFRHELEAHVFGTLDGAPGYYVFTPFELSGDGSLVYVNRGFVPQALKDPAARADGQVDGSFVVRGLFRQPAPESGLAALFAPPADPAANIWHRRDPALFARAAGVDAAPVYIDSFGAENPAPWPKGGVTRVEFPNRHLEYALTWFGLAAALLGVWFAFSTARGR